MAKRNTVISISKGIAIILMVIGHAEGPGFLTSFIYTFHMPLFFIAAGYFFNRERSLADPWSFISKRLKGLYVPMVKWSLIFLLLHNLWFHIGLLNEQFGNWSGGVTHPYTLATAVDRAWRIVTGMGGYDEFMAGAFWFFRGLLLASVGFLLLSLVLDGRRGLGSPMRVTVAICLLALAVIAIRLTFKITYCPFPNGGWRETWGIFFFGLGVLYRAWESRIPDHWAIASVCAVFLGVAAWNHFSGMNNGARMQDIITLPLTGAAGFLLVHYVASLLDRRDTRLRRWLVFVGDNTLWIFIFHIISFKVVSVAKVMWYDLDWGQVGCHMVIHDCRPDWFWLFYTIAGVGIPLAGITLWRRAAAVITRRRADAVAPVAD